MATSAGSEPVKVDGGDGLGACALVAFAATSDGARARSFYISVLGLRLVSDGPQALVLDANGTMLRIQKVDRVNPAPYTSLGWSVPDIAATIRSLVARGVVFERYPGLDQNELGIWRSPAGARVAWFKDPDGTVLSLTQF